MSDPKKPGLSIIIATYNRAPILRETLERIMTVDCNGLSVDWIFVDNNSTDATREVILSYANRLPLKYLFDPRPGKNCALNRALRDETLREIVVFTDDDILPRKDWLQQIMAASARWQEFDIFGGKIEVVWPAGRELRVSDKVKAVCFGHHDFGSEPIVYPNNWHPFGGNFWLRRKILDNGCLFNESMGPRPKNRISGGESSLLVKLEKRGHKMLYCPTAVVGHCIEARETSFTALLRRGYRSGRGYAHLSGIKDATLYDRAPRLWLLRQWLKLGYDAIKIVISLGLWSQKSRIGLNFDAMTNVGWIMESFKLLRSRRKQSGLRAVTAIK